MNDIHRDVKGQTEDALQQKCVFWFHNHFPKLRGLLFSVPNGGLRSAKEGKKMRLTGQTAGVADLLLMYNKTTYCIELKKDRFATQSVNQKCWQQKVEFQGFSYFIIRSLEDFKKLIYSIFISNNEV